MKGILRSEQERLSAAIFQETGNLFSTWSKDFDDEKRNAS
jgi:hypothetical protein